MNQERNTSRTHEVTLIIWKICSSFCALLLWSVLRAAWWTWSATSSVATTVHTLHVISDNPTTMWSSIQFPLRYFNQQFSIPPRRIFMKHIWIKGLIDTTIGRGPSATRLTRSLRFELMVCKAELCTSPLCKLKLWYKETRSSVYCRIHFREYYFELLFIFTVNSSR